MALTLKKIEKLAEGRHFDRDGVYLEMSKTGNGSWLLRYQRDGKERWLGLGPLRDFELDEARERARGLGKNCAMVSTPSMPSASRGPRRSWRPPRITFEKAARATTMPIRSKWSAKHREAFINTLQQYAFPVLGELPVASHRHRPGARGAGADLGRQARDRRRIRARIEKVLDWCTVRGYREGDNPARWRGHLKEALPSKIVTVVNHPALAYDDVPTFVQQLSKRQGVAPKALEFIILTAAEPARCSARAGPRSILRKRFGPFPPAG